LKQCSEPATASIRSFVACCSASDDSLCVSWSRKKKTWGLLVISWFVNPSNYGLN
jgi:hypothetical protein